MFSNLSGYWLVQFRSMQGPTLTLVVKKKHTRNVWFALLAYLLTSMNTEQKRTNKCIRFSYQDFTQVVHNHAAVKASYQSLIHLTTHIKNGKSPYHSRGLRTQGHDSSPEQPSSRSKTTFNDTANFFPGASPASNGGLKFCSRDFRSWRKLTSVLQDWKVFNSHFWLIMRIVSFYVETSTNEMLLTFLQSNLITQQKLTLCGLYSTLVTYLLLAQQPCVWFKAFSRIFILLLLRLLRTVDRGLLMSIKPI